MERKILGLIIALLAVTCAGVYCLQVASDDIDENVAKERTVVQSSENVAQTVSNDVNTKVQSSNKHKKKKFKKIKSKGKIHNYSGIIVLDKNAYELFTYREECAKAYSKSVNNFAKKLDGKAKVYDLLIPLGSGVIFPDNRVKDINSTDQHKAIENVNGFLDKDINKVDVYDNLMNHRKEYIYFRTDHHWTALGAYYAYESFCESKGIEPEKLDSYKKKDFKGFLGSFYNDTSSKTLKKNADTVTAYYPNCNSKMKFKNVNNKEIEWPVIYDVSKYGASLKYSAFIGGDNPYTEIENEDLNDGSSCIVVKESFGNAFVPFLVDHYQKIYVVDYRYYSTALSKLQKKTKAQDIIFVNNLSMIRNQYLVGQFQGVVK